MSKAGSGARRLDTPLSSQVNAYLLELFGRALWPSGLVRKPECGRQPWNRRLPLARRETPCLFDTPQDQLLTVAYSKSALDANGLLNKLKKTVSDRALSAEKGHYPTGHDAGGEPAAPKILGIQLLHDVSTMATHDRDIKVGRDF